MSRIGRSPISIPDGVTVECATGRVQVKGPKGSLSGALPTGIAVKIEGGVVSFARSDDRKVSRALHGLARAVVANMVTGVTHGFSKDLEIEGVGYRAELQGKRLNLALGFSHPVTVPVPDELKLSLDGNTKIRIEGID
ncbi:MAG: 50S ribosomal protein L6, partial [Myxococcota bacterium]